MRQTFWIICCFSHRPVIKAESTSDQAGLLFSLFGRNHSESVTKQGLNDNSAWAYDFFGSAGWDYQFVEFLFYLVGFGWHVVVAVGLFE